ncbi:hypothetical protein HID58_070397 [Brassica napus]|uniref:Uncharacterized protein n=1 Tax=Brassica napus TaxID=3708 RepID=A0ABQ7YYN1_BRANA|nr:hypothetical protein HID58_070397 [Brassica napus]
MVPKVGYHNYTEDTGVKVSQTGRDQVELAGEHNHATVQLAGELTGAMAELTGRVHTHGGSARRRADRRDG